MGIWLAEAPDDPVAITLGPDGPRAREGFDHPIRRAEYSHRLWPEPSGLPVRIGDASRELDQTFAGDRALVSLGYRAVLVLALGRPDRFLGILWLAAREANVYTADHVQALQPVVDLATLAIEHDQLQTLVAERRRRGDALEALLQTLARTLDLQEVFAQISEVTQSVLAPDYLSVGLLTEDGGIRFHASSRGPVTDVPIYRPKTELGAKSLQWEYYIVRNYTVLRATWFASSI